MLHNSSELFKGEINGVPVPLSRSKIVTDQYKTITLSKLSQIFNFSIISCQQNSTLNSLWHKVMLHFTATDAYICLLVSEHMKKILDVTGHHVINANIRTQTCQITRNATQAHLNFNLYYCWLIRVNPSTCWHAYRLPWFPNYPA